MKRTTLGITTALVAAAAPAATGTLGANTAPQPRNLTQQEALHAAAEQAGTISSAADGRPVTGIGRGKAEKI